MSDYQTVLLSFLGGIIPILFWLDFWLRKDVHRAPRKLVLSVFLLGFPGVFIAGFAEEAVSIFVVSYTTLSLVIWSVIEEGVKFAAAYFGALRSRYITERIDPMIYLITSALGFAAFENMIFLFEPVGTGDFLHSIGTLGFRFAGATLLHTVSSGVIGLFFAFAFYKSKTTRFISGMIGFALSVVLHAAFNRFIIDNEHHVFIIFSVVWIGIIGLIIFLEKIKRAKKIS